jgi:hypothetical protein
MCRVFFEAGRVCGRKLDAGKRIAGFQQFDIEVNMQVGLKDKVLQESCIALLGLAFAADKDRLALRDEGATRFHPICGTPP